MNRRGRRLIAIGSAGLVAGLLTAAPTTASAAEPHPAVARIVVQEADGVAYGSGTLVDVREDYGLVATNWHVVRDAVGKIEVAFPGGFRSEARALKLDEDWDLAALVVWRPPLEPAPIAATAPRPGEPLTICGYGQGEYRAATGRCTEYYAPKAGMPHELVELSVEARQGDSGGPIFNQRGELAGVLFGAGQGTTMGAFGGRVQAFLSTLAADIGKPQPHRGVEPIERRPPLSPVNESMPTLVALAESPAATPRSSSTSIATEPSSLESNRPSTATRRSQGRSVDPATLAEAGSPPLAGDALADYADTLASDQQTYAPWRANTTPSGAGTGWRPPDASTALMETPPKPAAPAGWLEAVKSSLALVGAVSLMVMVVRAIT